MLITPVLYPQFFGLEALKEKYSTSQANFWAVTAPITCMIMAITLYYVISSQYELRKIVRFIGRLFWQWRIDLPLSLADAHEQKQFLNRLPLYQVKIKKYGPKAAPPSATAATASAAQAPALSPQQPPAEYLRFPEGIGPTSRPHAQVAE